MRLAKNSALGFEVNAIRSLLLITATAVALTLSSNARAGVLFQANPDSAQGVLFQANPDSAQGVLFQANLDSAQVPPPTSNSPATGVGLFTLNAAQTQLSFSVTYQNLVGTITGAHFHDNVFGVRGPLEHEADITGATPMSGTLTGVWSSTDPTTPLTPGLVGDMFAGKMYIDLHTTAFPMGEIRGQISVVPEPASLTPFGLGILGLAGYVWLRKRATACVR